MKNRSRISIAAMLLLFSISNAKSFCDPGTAELSGSFAYANSGNGGDRINIVQFTPSYAWYIQNGFFFGPILSFPGTFAGGDKVLSMEAGGLFGKCFKAGGARPYLFSGVEFLLTNTYDKSNPGIGVPVGLGVKFLIAEHLGIDFGARYWIGRVTRQRELIQDVQVGAGISGFLY